MWSFRTPGSLEGHEPLVDTFWQAGASGIEERDGQLVAYFPQQVPLELSGEWVREEEHDWQERWKRDLKPVRAGQVTIVPPWLQGEVEPAQVPLVVDVGMAFGTGHHATTRLAVEALAALNWERQAAPGGRARVLDVGTGSGVLAIAACLLGAGEAVGVDIDPITIPAAIDNARLNGFRETPAGLEGADGARLAFLEGTIEDAVEDGKGPYDVLAANLYAELHDALMPQYRQAVRPGGLLILTGILQERLGLVLDAVQREGLRLRETHRDGEWALVTVGG